MLRYTIILTVLVVSHGIKSDSSCREHYGLEDVCWKTGERYAFHCLIHQSSKNTYYSVQKKGQTQTDIIWHDNKILIENGEDKYTVETTRVNASYRCISLFISVDESDSGSYYRCGADGQDYQKHAQLFLASFATLDGQGLRGHLDVDVRKLNNISIVATVSRFNGIPGLEVLLYINENQVAKFPQAMSCQTEDNYELRHYYDATDPVVDYMVIRLTYTHGELPREVQLVSNSHRFNNKKVEDDDNLITPRGYMNIENEGGTMERVTGLVWNVPAQYVDIFVDGVVINSNAKTYKDGQIEITGHFDSAAINVEDIHIELVYRNQNGTEYGVLSTVHFTLRIKIKRSTSPWIFGMMVFAIIAFLTLVAVLIICKVMRQKKSNTKKAAGEQGDSQERERMTTLMTSQGSDTVTSIFKYHSGNRNSDLLDKDVDMAIKQLGTGNSDTGLGTLGIKTAGNTTDSSALLSTQM